jgi:hypothetical protein
LIIFNEFLLIKWALTFLHLPLGGIGLSLLVMGEIVQLLGAALCFQVHLHGQVISVHVQDIVLLANG